MKSTVLLPCERIMKTKKSVLLSCRIYPKNQNTCLAVLVVFVFVNAFLENNLKTKKKMSCCPAVFFKIQITCPALQVCCSPDTFKICKEWNRLSYCPYFLTISKILLCWSSIRIQKTKQNCPAVCLIFPRVWKNLSCYPAN